LKVGGGAKDPFPDVRCRDDGQTHGLALFLCHGQYFCEEQLLDRTENLVGSEIVFAGSSAAHETNVQDYNFGLLAF